MERRGAVMDMQNAVIGAGSHRMELFDGVGPIRRNIELLYFLSRPRRLVGRRRARAPAIGIFLRRTDHRRNRRSMERRSGDFPARSNNSMEIVVMPSGCWHAGTVSNKFAIDSAESCPYGRPSGRSPTRSADAVRCPVNLSATTRGS